MSLPPVNVSLALRAIRHAQAAGYMRHAPSCTICEPREVWFPGPAIWVRVNGSWISGGLRGGLRPGLIDRWRIRRAFSARTKPIAGTL